MFQKITYDYRRRSKLRTKTAKDITFNLDKHLFFLAASRICSLSEQIKNSADEFSFAYDYDYSDITLANLYRSLAILSENKSLIIKTLDNNIRELRERKLTLCLLDLTSFSCKAFVKNNVKAEGESKSEAKATDKGEGGGKGKAREQGKDHKLADSQVVMALIVDADGLPLTYRLLRGDNSKINSLPGLISELKKEFKIDSIIVVADGALNSLENIKFLMENNLKFVFNYPLNNSLEQEEKSFLLKDEDWFEYGDKGSRNYYKLKEFVLKRELKTDNQNKKLQLRFISKFSSKRYSEDSKDLESLLTKAAKSLAKGSAYVELPSKKSQACLSKVPSKEKIERVNVKKVLNYDSIEKRMYIAGYSGLVTNIDVQAIDEVEKIFSHLSKVENNFYLFNTDMVAKPLYIKKEEVEGHFLSCFIALTIGKLLLLELKEAGIVITYDELLEQLKGNFINFLIGKQGSQETIFFNSKSFSKELPANKEESATEINFSKILQVIFPKFDIKALSIYRYFYERELKALCHTKLKVENLSENAFTTIK